MFLKEFYQYKRIIKTHSFFYKHPLKVRQGYFLDKNLMVSTRDSFNILYIKSSLSNVIVTLTNLKGKVFFVKSCGSLGFKGKKQKRTKFAIETTLKSVISLIKDLGSTKVLLCLDGYTKVRFFFVNLLKKNQIHLIGIRDITSDSHNGCRPKKLRRG